MGLSLEPALWQKNLLCMRRALRLGGDAPPSSECKRARKAQVHLLCIELLPPERPSQHMNMVGGGGSGAWAALVLCFGITSPSEVPVPFTGERLCDKWREERTWPNQSRSSFLGHVTVCAAGSSSLRDSVTQALPACGFTVPGVLSSRPSSESNEHMAFGTNRKHESKVTLPELI